MILRLVGAIALLLLLATPASPQAVRVAPPSGPVLARQVTLNSSNGGEQLSSSSVPVLAVIVKAATTNTVAVHVGGSDLNASSQPGYRLAAGASVPFDVANLNQIYVDAGTTASQVVEYFAVKGP